MPEISADDLRRMHANLTLASVGQDASGAAALAPRIEMAREKIIRLSRDRDETNAKNERLTEDIAQALAERDAAITNLAKEEARITEAHAALDEAGAPACDGVLSGRITALAADLDQSNRSLGSAMWDRDTLRAEVETLRARLAERPAPPDHRDPPVETAAEATVRRLRSYLSDRKGFDYTGANYDDTDFVEVAIHEFRESNKTIRSYQDRLERVEGVAIEQLRHRIRGT